MENETIFDLIHTMDQVTNKLIINWTKMFNENLGISHILVLKHLHENGQSRPSDIAKSLGLTPPSLTHLSDKLIKKGLITRLNDEGDRRIFYLNITDSGFEVLMNAQEKGNSLRKELFEKLTAEEQKQLLHIYSKLSEHI